MYRIVDPRKHCAERGLAFHALGNDFICEVRDARVFSVGCVESGGDILVRGMSSGWYEANVAQQLRPYVKDGLINIPDSGEVFDEAVLLWGDRNFGHWIFTYLNRLTLLFYRPELLEKPLLVPDNLPASFYDWIGLMGFRHVLRAKDGCRVRRLWVPSVVHYRDENKKIMVSPQSVNLFRHALGNNYAPSERVYISRERAAWRKIKNEYELIATLQRHDFWTSTPEILTAQQQLTMVTGCSQIVSVIGGSSPLTMLAPRSCKIVDIGLPGFGGVFGSFAWATILGQPYARMDGEPVTPKDNNSDMTVDVKKLEALL